MKNIKKDILIYTDGGVQHNGKPYCFGACAYLILINGDFLDQNVQCLYNTTNNRAELQSIINSLTFLKERHLTNDIITIHSDSQYCIKGCSLWMYSWQKNRFMRDGELIPNSDLWMEIFDLVKSFKNLNFKWVKGHSVDEWNNYVNDLCTERQEKMIEGVLL